MTRVSRLLVVLAIVMMAVPPVPAPAQAPEDCKVIETFANAKVGELPDDWKVRKDAGKEVYAVREEEGRRFLRASARGLGVQAAKQLEWDLDAYPVLAWSWRPLEFPRGADEKDGKNDSVLAVYMLVPYSRIRGPKAVKYVWSEKVPAGTRLSSNSGLTQVRVLESGTDRQGQWVEARANVREDYLKFFEEKDVPKPAGIAVLTDSDDTKSTARGDYANFRVCRK
jgi:hypothetical protein